MSAITSPQALHNYDITTVDFENIANLDGEEFGFQAGQPYANLVLFHAAIVQANANLNSSSGGVAVRSGTVYVPGNSNSLWWRFPVPQLAVGFFYKDAEAKSVDVLAFDVDFNLIERDTFPGGQGFAGIIRPKAEIGNIQILAPHETTESAFGSRTLIDDLSFASRRKILHWTGPGSGPAVERGTIVIVIGGIRIDGGGVVIGPGGVTPVPPWNPETR
jgi:hypothetical protein